MLKLYLALMSDVKWHGAESRIKPWTGSSKLAEVGVDWTEVWPGNAPSAAASAFSTVPKNRNPALL